MFKLVIADDESKTTVVPLVRDEITIGRKEGNTIRLTERNVSRRHAKLFKENGAYVVEDINSYNGIRLNGVRVKGRAQLKHGDEITIGDYRLSLVLEGAEAAAVGELTIPMEMPTDAATAMIASPSEPAAPARLVMISPPSAGAEFAISRSRSRIGRAEDLDVSVNHRSVSREHAEVIRDGDGYKIIDLESANGLRVNGRDVQQADLVPGDVVELGQVRFRFVAPGEVYRFDADQTIQMDAVRVEDRSRAPLVVGVLLIAVAIVLATLLALAGEGDRNPHGPTLPTNVTEPTSIVTPTGPTGPVALADGGRVRVPIEPQFNASTVLAQAQQSLDTQRWEDASAMFDRVLQHDPSNAQAQAGRTRAMNEIRAKAAYEEGRARYESSQLDDAFHAFAQIRQDSYYRTRPEVRDTTSRFVASQLERAAHIGAGNPRQVLTIARELDSIPDLPPEYRGRVRQLLRSAQRAVNALPQQGPSSPTVAPTRPTAPTQTQPPTQTTPPTERGPSPLEQARGCVTRGDQHCVIRVLQGRSGASELRLLISTYRAVRDGGSTIREMRRYISRYPNDSYANMYRQFLTAHGQ